MQVAQWYAVRVRLHEPTSAMWIPTDCPADDEADNAFALSLPSISAATGWFFTTAQWESAPAQHFLRPASRCAYLILLIALVVDNRLQ
jgi:hypothetical protein